MELSFSMFAAWRRGPAEYKLRFVDGRRPPLDEPSSLGISLHRALERYHRAGEPGWEALAQAYEAEFLRAGYPDEEARERWRRKGLRILKAYQRGESSRRTKILGNEREFVFPLGRHTVRGMVDRIDLHPDGRVELIDYKTRLGLGAADPIAPFEEAWLQLRFYALGVKECFAYEPALLTIHYLAAGRLDTRAYDPSGEEELKAEILRVADAIENTEK